jgi:hypothetical protein
LLPGLSFRNQSSPRPGGLLDERKEATMQLRRQIAAFTAVASLSGALCLGAVPAQASSRSRERNWRIGTYVGSAATIAGLASGNDTLSIIGGAGTLLSFIQWKREMHRRHRREDRAAYRAYRSHWLRTHRRYRR